MSSPVVITLSSTSTQKLHAHYTHIKHKSNKTNKPAIAINTWEYIYMCMHALLGCCNERSAEEEADESIASGKHFSMPPNTARCSVTANLTVFYHVYLN